MIQFDQETDVVIKNQWEHLPQRLKDSIATGSYKVTVEQIARQHQLESAQRNELEQEVLLVLLGLEEVSDVRQALIDVCHLSENTAAEVSKLLNDALFLPLSVERSTRSQNDTHLVGISAPTTLTPTKEATAHPYTTTDPYREPPQ